MGAVGEGVDADEALGREPRLLSLDVFRGLTIAGMILVNNPGSHAHVYWFLRHAQWNGCLPADLIFPFFLFIVGVSISFAVAGPLERGAPRRQLLAKVLRRTRILFGLGLLLNALPFFDWDVLRIPGVLQRIAVCYGLASVIVLYAGIRWQIAWGAVFLLVYWALMTLVPVPGYGAGVLLPEHNLAAYIDRTLMGEHLANHSWDPEGLLGTVPATATTLAGVMAGHWLRRHQSHETRLEGLLLGGVAALVGGLAMAIWLPINKNLWTSSYALFCAGLASIALAGCYWIIDVRGYRGWAKPFAIYGTNPILAYWLSSAFAKLMALVTVAGPHDSRVTLRIAIYHEVFRRFAPPQMASLLFALSYTMLWLGVLTVLYRRQIFVKV